MRRLTLPGYGLADQGVTHASQRRPVIIRPGTAEGQGGSPAPVTAPARQAMGTGARQQARVQV